MTPKKRTRRTSAQLVRVESRIVSIRGAKVIFDFDLAKVYGVTTSRLNEQVGRNLDRFPEDFMFQLSEAESDNLISQNAISRSGHGGTRKLPYVFTEHGAIMAANVLKSKRAAQMSVFVVRAFVRIREVVAAHRELSEKINELEERVDSHDANIQGIIEAIRQLMNPPVKRRKRIGFRLEEPRAIYRVKRK